MPARRLPLILMIVLAACGGEVAATTTPTSPPSTTTTVPSTTTTVPRTTLAETTTTAAPAGGVPVFLATGVGGIGLSDGTTLVPPPAPDQPYQLGTGIDDGAGGIVYSLVEPAAGVVEWLAAGEGFVRPVLEGFDLYLHDVTLLGDVPWAVVTRWEPPDPSAERMQYIELVRLDSGETKQVGQVGGVEWGASFVSYADGYFLVTEINDGCGALYVLDVAGNRVEFSGVPVPACTVHFEIPFGPAALAPAGTRFAYVEMTFTPGDGSTGPTLSGSRLVVRDLNASDDQISIDLGGSEFRDLDFDGRWVLLTPASSSDQLLAVDTAADTPALVPAGGAGAWSARFVRLPVSLSG